jgi:hypothetical protein
MMRLLGVELRRFAWRRSFRVFGLIALVGIALSATIAFFTSHPGPTAFGFVDPGFRLESLPDIFGGTSIPLIILGLAFGASFIGAEWHAGTITPLLTWQPRRVMVFVTKGIAISVAVVASAIALQTILGLALWPVSVLRGTTAGTDAAWFAETVGIVVRGAIIAGLMAVLGFAIGSIARNTTVALIIGFVYFAIGEAILRGLRPGWQPWLIGDNAAAFVIGEDEVFFIGHGHSALTSLLVVAAYAGLALTLATAWFQARDVN